MRDIAEELHDEWMKAGHHTDNETLIQLLERAVRAGHDLAQAEHAGIPEEPEAPAEE
jgi:hypothetical protein